MQRWVPLAASVVLLLAAGTWFGLEFTCGDTTRPQTLPGQPPAPEECARGDMVLPTFGLAAALAYLFAGIIAWRKPAETLRPNGPVVRLAYWPLLAAATFFTGIHLGGVGVYIFPLVVIAVLLALWARNAGPWAVAAGAALNLLSSGLQWVRELEAVRQPANAPEEFYVMPWWSLAFLAGSGVFAAIGSPFWPQWWSYVFLVPALGGWASLFLEQTPVETLFFALPGMFLITAGLIRCIVGTYQPGPVEAEKPDAPLYPELEGREPRRSS